MAVEEPYDNLSFLPTVLALGELLRDDSSPTKVLWERGFLVFPGWIISEIFQRKQEPPKFAVTGANPSP